MNNLDHVESIRLERLQHAGTLQLPAYESAEAAGMDLRAALAGPVTIRPGERMLIPTGFKIGLPAGYEAQIRPRSGLALKHGITLLNTPGTIDSDYRGELKILIINHGQEPFKIHHGDRIAQMVIATVTRLNVSETASLDVTERGGHGFGSTGI